MKTRKAILLLLVGSFFLVSCASQSGWTPTVDPTTSPAAYGGYPQQPPPPQYPAQQYPQQQYPQQYQTPPPAPTPPVTYPQGTGSTYSQPATTTAPPPPPRRSYTQDLTECKMLAQRVSGYTPGEAIKGGLIGGAIGAAAGAAIGAAVGDPGKGAAIGAAAGGIGGGTYNAVEAERKYKQAYINCMRQRGWNVINP